MEIDLKRLQDIKLQQKPALPTQITHSNPHRPHEWSPTRPNERQLFSQACTRASTFPYHSAPRYTTSLWFSATCTGSAQPRITLESSLDFHCAMPNDMMYSVLARADFGGVNLLPVHVIFGRDGSSPSSLFSATLFPSRNLGFSV
jgi:hypothetical protein